MSKEIEMKRENVDLENREKVELVKRMFAKGATDDEFAVFLELAKRYNLDPFKRQIFFLPDKRMNEPGKIMVSHAGLIHIAHSSGQWGGMKTFIITKDGEERLIVDNPNDIAGAVCYVYRKDWKEPLIHAVAFREYFKQNQSKQGSWYTMPQTMIKKVAEAGALRRAFDLGGLYIEEEMDTSYTVYDVSEEEKEIKETKKEVPNAYITRLYSYIQAFAKKYDKKEENVIKHLEKKLGKVITEFSTSDIMLAIDILKELIKKEKEKEKEKEEIKPDDFEIPEITVEEPHEEAIEDDEMNEWLKKISETFNEISE
ncbi:MAG: phage recombination protein Bet [Atribacterota bacterium]|nr:phage recombination protein Bet [Atribacterota bacterium]